VGSLRAGAGKLRVAVAQPRAPWVAAAVPEARVFSLPGRDGSIDLSAAEVLAHLANDVQAVLIGPGMADEDATARLMKTTLPLLYGPAIVDAAALKCLGEDPELLHDMAGRAAITPNVEEMASCLGVEETRVTRDPLAAALHASDLFRCVVVLKGAQTVVAGTDGECYVNVAGNVGLATSGSGDVLAGVIAGLAARGADPLQAAVWGVYLHARAGDRLSRMIGPLGFLAGELPAQIPRLMERLSQRKKQ